MSILTVSNLNHSYGGREILQNVNFRLLKGEHVGLVGPNGEGKSSFMNIVTGRLMPDEGKIEWARRVRIGYLDQHASLSPNQTVREVLRDAFAYLYEMEAEVTALYGRMGEAAEDELPELLEDAAELQSVLEHNDFYMIDAKVEETAGGMGLKALGLDTLVSELSGGQRSKVLLAKLLLQKPDILLLDEPTNYLDEENIEWLRRYLQNYENAFLLISHDIPFLNSVINLIYHIENKEMNRYVGDYSEFERMRDIKKSQIEAAYKKQQQEIADLEDFVARNKARVATRNMAMSRQKKLDKMERIELVREKPKPEFYFKTAPATSKLIFETEGLVIGYDMPLTRPLKLRMERGDRIAVTGPNGLGKSTLLKTILGELPPLGGTVRHGENLKIGYFQQEESAGNMRTAFAELWEEFPAWQQYEIRAALAKCGLTTDHIESKIMVLSGGEQAKVRLCKILNKETNILVLDEPTNHLDADAKEELKRALREYKGGIFLVSHEKEFYQEIATEVWNMEDFAAAR